QKLQSAEHAMKDATEALAKNKAKQAETPQEKASEELKEARKELDRLIAAAEKEKNDPLAALQKAAEQLDKIIKEQTDTRDQTKQPAKDKKVAKLADKQKDLAQQTQLPKDTPLPSKEKTDAALEQANKAMKEAAKNLDKKEATAAVPKQDQALKALQEARQE